MIYTALEFSFRQRGILSFIRMKMQKDWLGGGTAYFDEFEKFGSGTGVYLDELCGAGGKLSLRHNDSIFRARPFSRGL